VYFVVHLQDDFDIKEGIVVVDDPVSSLDSNSIYQAFAFLKNAVKDAHQVFLFTHNFDFLRLLLDRISR
jgi:wobble nucleotide-excising tRNase